MSNVYSDVEPVEEKEVLSVGKYVLGFKDAPTYELTKVGKAIAERGETVPEGEYNIVADLVPEGFPESTFRHWFSLKPGARKARSTTISIHRFLDALGFTQASVQGEGIGQPVRVTARDGSEVLLKYLRLRATIKHEKQEGFDRPNIRLDKVEGSV
ncbi:MAG: hypothetical protein AAB721_00120 [Patescibacteria group bacterium]